ncbi:hypothetical protein [Pararhodobacter marinus]|uniref:hypothetical protein n=1 Tax=Pararhodobacter marinus TaxID=2184063 RepID=UPI003518EC44
MGPAILRYTPVAALDFNAAGLLYFPTFSKIAEMACPRAAPLLRRQITCPGNLDPGEDILVEPLRDDETATWLRLWAKGRALAEISTQRCQGSGDPPTLKVTGGHSGASGSVGERNLSI